MVGWKEVSSADGGGERVGFSRSLDHGATWSPNVLMKLITPTYNQSDPWLAVDPGGRVYFSRLEYMPDFTKGGLVVSYTDDQGTTWGGETYVNDSRGTADKEVIVSDGDGTVYVVYDELLIQQMEGSVENWVNRSVDGGRSWSSGTQMQNWGLFPAAVARPHGLLWVARLVGDNLTIQRSMDGGVTWSPEVRVNDVVGTVAGPGGWYYAIPSLAMGPSGTLYAAWPDFRNGNLDIYFSRSDDGGDTWSPAVQVNDDTSGKNQWEVALAVDNAGGLHAAWIDDRTGNHNVFYSFSEDGGLTWSANVRVTNEETPSFYDRPGDYLGLATDSQGAANIAWTDGRGTTLSDPNLDIYFARVDPRTDRAPITIVGDSGFTPANGVRRGSGTQTDPYVIEGWAIDSSWATGIDIRDTRAYFVVRGVSIYSGTGAHYGISLIDAFHGTVEAVIISGQGGGIYIQGAFYISIANSTVSQSGDGIVIFYGTQWLNLTGNNLTSNDVAVNAAGGTYVTIAGNYVSNNSKGLSVVAGSEHYLVYHNNFMGNMVQAEDLTNNQVAWDAGYPAGGNYWSNYVGVDNCRGPAQNNCVGPDGKGDVSSAVDSDTVDRYPLINPFIPNAPPVADFTISPTSPRVGGTVFFNATRSYAPYGDLVSYAWAFGDGSTGNGVTIDHIYYNAGNFTAVLRITDVQGLTAFISRTVIVYSSGGGGGCCHKK